MVCSMTNQDSSGVVRTLRTLEALANGPCSASGLAADLDAHPRTVRRLLTRLVDEGYARRGARAEYIATLKLVALAGRVLERTDLVSLAFSYVARLRNATGEASHFSVPSEEGVLHLVQETGESVVMVKPRLGEIVPYHCTASGKALLAYSPTQLESVLARGLPPLTEHTITDPGDFLLDLAQVRERGYAIDDLESSVDLRCVAAPVFDHGGGVIGCIGISAPAMRLAVDDLPAVASHVVEVARALSGTLGHDHSGTDGPGVGVPVPAPAVDEERR